MRALHEPVGIGLLGCGRIADLQCLGYRDRADARIVAVCDRDEGLARRRAAQWNVPRAYARIEDLLADAAVDAIEVLTPHHLHADHARAAFAAGKHVSLQKPPTRTLAELDTVCAAAAQARRTLRVFENFMHYPPHRKAKALIDDGAIGVPLSVRIKTAAGRVDAGWPVDPAALAW
ncbi:MAG: Gfo/Idh/MocA family oxidoreductase, partial [Proteobacteria bacterium]|nr:Gfo/Idh/MocA family oxidoreductase [Pseudomonadota bacterium]